jgi:transcriptional repressor NrdR
MECYICHNQTKVSNSRKQRKRNQVWRRRVCVNCDYIFTTVEKVDLEHSLVVEYINGEISNFIREELLISINKGLKHRKNHLNDSISLTDTIISKLLVNNSKPLVTRNDIINTSLSVLKNFDNLAYTSYTAYHPLD